MGRVPVRCAPPPCGKRRLRRLSPLPSPHPFRLKEVVYTLSNHNQNVMAGLWKDLPYKVTKKVKENWIDTLFFLVPVIGTYECVPRTLSALALGNRPGKRLPAACSLADGGGAVAHAAQCSARRRGRKATLGRGGWFGGTPPQLLTPSSRARYAKSYKEKEKLHHRF